MMEMPAKIPFDGDDKVHVRKLEKVGWGKTPPKKKCVFFG